jgi:hypothetical protein
VNFTKPRPKHKEQYQRKHTKAKNVWMTTHCVTLRRYIRNIGKKISTSPNNYCYLLHIFSRLKKQYNKLRKKPRQDYLKFLAEKMNNLNPNCSKLCWKNLKAGSKPNIPAASPIQLCDWVIHFSNLLQSKDNDSSLDYDLPEMTCPIIHYM